MNDEQINNPKTEDLATQKSSIPRWKLRPEKQELKFTVQDSSFSQFKIWAGVTIVIVILTNLLTASFFMMQNKNNSPNQNGTQTPTILSPFSFLKPQPSPSSDPETSSPQPQSPGITSPNNQPIGPLDFTQALNKASDTRRQADLMQISTALNIYTAEVGPPEDFPSKDTCIGTAPDCYDLVSLLSPDFIAEFPKDPKGGTEEFTGYYFYVNETGGFTLKAIGENSQEITINR